MADREPGRAADRRTHSTIFAALVLGSAALVGGVIHQALPSTSSSATSSLGVPRGDHRGAPGAVLSHPPRTEGAPDRETRSRGAVADGAVPDGVTVFDDGVPAVAKLDPDLLRALRQAAKDARNDGVGFVVNSGWRSRRYQEQLLREAVSKYGSAEEAARWVATAETSRHVSGNAVDLGPDDARAWLSKHGAEYGLCQIYDNEPWHYELRPKAAKNGCPARYADPTQDPRLRR